MHNDETVRDWRYVHNLIIPTHELSEDDVRERSGRNHLEVAHHNGVLIGCTTVRPPEGDGTTATVIARVLPAHRRRGLGEQLYVQGLAKARALGAREIETVVPETDTDGLSFAAHHGFVEVETYVLPGETVPWYTLRLV